MSEPDDVTAAYSSWLNAILEKHAKQLWDAAEGDLDDEQLNENWEDLPAQLRCRLWGLSADLFSLADNEKFTDADWEPISQQELAKLLTGAFQERQWDKLLELLRRPPRFVAGDQVSYVRGRAWQELGQPHVALHFFDNASRLKPGHAPYRILALECLKASSAWAEAINRATKYSLDPTSPPSLLFRAGDVFHAYLMAQVEDQANLAQRAVDIVNQGFDKRFPNNPELLTARGLLRLECHMEGAFDDFRDAIKRAARSVWPYLELARNHYSEHNYDGAIELCRLALEKEKATQDSDAALLRDLLARALFERNESAAVIKKEFQTAICLDPFNPAIRHNYDRFLTASEYPDQAVGGEWETSPLPIHAMRREVYQFVQPRFSQAA